MKLRRSMLFIPGNNPGMIQNAGVLGADSIILDLEDAVSISEKDSARILVRNALKFLDFYDTEVVVRINPLSTDFGYDDIKEISKVRPHGLLIPKSTEEDIKACDDILNRIEEFEGMKRQSIKLFPLIETAYGLENVYNIIKSSERVEGVLIGAEDLTADLGIKRTKEGDEIFYARCKVASACRAFRVDAIDTPFTDLNDEESFIKDINRAKSIGMTGKAAINPRQIDTIHEVFAPSLDEINYAIRIMKAKDEAKKEGKGVFSLDGKMVDAPIIARAQNILDKAKLSGLYKG
ncbi:CoA ester lyase [Caloramator sp. E03]|uniref:HpcH/HpaI aldolase/citrate lyase family protein n=1 Tax=Caloramator sp. E03 TaxID=2576307 RepID=UPI00110FFAF3|nr:CoA ester lyase [Caloramator sp. E03]QCX33050.1 CoA ester lyase [Caloramator sp. E03]